MMQKPFNRLSVAELERLAILAEECAEVTQAVMKILRHGYESTNPKIANSETNREALQRELGDLQHALARMTDCGDLNQIAIDQRRRSKPSHIVPYLHHQPDHATDAPTKPTPEETASDCGKNLLEDRRPSNGRA